MAGTTGTIATGTGGAISAAPGAGGVGAPSPTGGTGGADQPGPTAGNASDPGMDAGIPVPAPVEELDPNVDWTALTIVYPTMYSGYDGEHTFQLPAYVDMATVELSGWQAIPSSAVTFDPDPDTGGVMITIQQGVPEVTIAASSGLIGGKAPLYITTGTPEQWEVGEARYNNGVEYFLPMLTFEQLIDPNWVPPPTPTNLACNNCHTTGAKYFEIQHTPTQIARISDEDLITIMTTGVKPPGVGFRILPPAFEHLYPEFHKWEAGDEEQKALILYLRSLTPTGQGDILLPDGGLGAPPTM